MKKKIIFALLIVVFSVPVGFGIYNLIPDPVPPTISYPVELVNTYNDGLSLSKNIAYPDYNFITDITLDRSIIKDKILPNQLGENDVLCLDKPITYTYSVNQDKFSARVSIPKENIKGKIKINIPLVTPTESFEITLNANTGFFSDDKKEIKITAHVGDRLIDLLGSGYERPSKFGKGYLFSNWVEEKDRSKTLYEDDLIPYAPEGITYLAHCELRKFTVTLNPGPGGNFPGKGLNEPVVLENVIYSTQLNKIPNYPGEPTKDSTQFLYYTDANSKQYLPTDLVEILDTEDSLTLTAQYRESISIVLKAGEGQFSPDAKTNFVVARGTTLGELDGYIEPTSRYLSRVFVYWTIEGGSSEEKIYQDTPLNMSGAVTLVANYEVCSHTFKGYTVINNRLCGICEKCGARVYISDEGLEQFNNQFLLLKDDVYELHDISDMPSIISSAPAQSILDLYFISGEYEIGGSHASGVTVNAHGLFKNDKTTRSATFDCTNIQPIYGPRKLENVTIICNNLIMRGEPLKSASWYVGIQAASITYNNCLFTGKQAIYSFNAYFNDCTFDPTNITDGQEYSIYGYGIRYGEFHRCHFITNGKALKIYNETSISTETQPAVYNIYDCTFAVKEEEFISDKAAIEIDSRMNYYNVTINHCQQSGYAKLWSDSAATPKSHVEVIE